MNIPKLDLTLLKRLVSEFEASAAMAETIYETRKEDPNAHVVEISKAQGLAAGIANEATLLISDMKALVKMTSTQSTVKDLADNVINEMFGGKTEKPGAN